MIKMVAGLLLALALPASAAAGYDPYRLKMSGYSREDIGFILDGATDHEQTARKSRLDYAYTLRSLGYSEEDVAYILEGGPDEERDLRKYELDVAVKYRLLGKSSEEAERLAAELVRQTRIAFAEAQGGGMVADSDVASAMSGPARVRKRIYGPIITEEAIRQGVDPFLCNAVTATESGFNAKAVSRAGAIGLMQLMPGTARMLGVSNAFDPRQNVRGGIQYLADQLKTFGRMDLALAAYNAGPEAVRKHRGIPPYAETIAYVQKVMKTYADLKAAGGVPSP